MSWPKKTCCPIWLCRTLKGIWVAGLILLFAHDAVSQPLVMPEYPADLADVALVDKGNDGTLFRLFLGELVYAAAIARDDSSRLSEGVASMRSAFAHYPNLLSWVNGDLARMIRLADVGHLIGDAEGLQARVDSLICLHLIREGLAELAARRGMGEETLQAADHLCQSDETRRFALGVLDRLYRESS